MFLTACAVCAKALNNDEARECEKCGTRFCGETCENDHRAQAKICEATSSRVLGSAHPDTKTYEKALAKAKKALAEKSSA